MIEVSDVTKRYGSSLAVDGVSFSIGPGEIAGFLGPNGAGKSTILKMLATWHAPTSGRVSVAGFDTQKQSLEVRKRIGYLAEHNALWETMNVSAFLDFVAGIHGLSSDQKTERKKWVVERCELGSVLSKSISACSKGFRQRIGVAAALIHDPPVLILDEPTHGLDPLQVAAFRDFIREIAGTGASKKAVLFSSHILSEVAAISDRVLLLSEGKLVLDETTEELQRRAAAANCDLETIVLERVRETSKTGATS